MCVGVFWLGMVPFSWCWTRTASHEENLAKSSFSDPLYLLSILFRIFGLPIDPQDHLYWKLYHFLIILCLLISFMGLVVSAIDKLNEDIFNTISAILFSFNGLLSYLCLSITVYSHQHNLLEIIKAIAKYSPAYSNSNNLLNFCNDTSLGSSSTQYLQFYSYKWLRIALAIGLLSYSLLFVAYGRHGDTHFFDVGKNPGWHLGNILYPYFNAGWLMPMVVVRVGCHFLEEKLFSFIEYLEEPESRAVASQRSQSLSRPRDSVSRDCVLSSRVLSAIHSLTSSDAPIVSQQHNPTIGSFSRISIKQIMSWYDELYALNQLLSNAFSLIIFQMIICIFPVVVFMLQGFLLQDISLGTYVALLYWISVNSFVLFVVTAGAARIDSLNIRIEISLATMPSSHMFSSEESVASFRLALSKVRSIPFGVNFFGLRKRISFQAMWTISSVVISVFLLMLGYSL